MGVGMGEGMGVGMGVGLGVGMCLRMGVGMGVGSDSCMWRGLLEGPYVAIPGCGGEWEWECVQRAARPCQ